MDQVGTIYKISQILANAFKEVNDVCAHYMADQVVQNGSSKHQIKQIEQKPVHEKPPQQNVAKQDNQPKKEQKK